MSGARRRPGAAVGALVMACVAAGAVGVAAAEGPAPDVGSAIQSLGPPGLLWGRLAVEEESPDGAVTPLAGVAVVAYPYVPAVAAELERIRESARESGRQHDTAISRLQEVLRVHQARLGAPRGRPPESTPSAVTPERPRAPPGLDRGRGNGKEDGPVYRRHTDTAGVFVFDLLPAGEWLIVAVRTTAYPAARAQREKPQAPRPREPQFVGRAAGSAVREAEVWVTRVRVEPGERVRLLWTDRARFMVGPLR